MYNDLIQEALTSLEPGFQLEAIQFEKDDDTNFHMEFIAGLANMRARNYTLQANPPDVLCASATMITCVVSARREVSSTWPHLFLQQHW